MIKDHGAPRRTVILAAWDREEDDLCGSKWYVDHPLVPLAQTVAYVNFDIQGANLLPSLQNNSFAVGAETGGATLTSLVQSCDRDARRCRRSSSARSSARAAATT